MKSRLLFLFLAFLSVPSPAQSEPFFSRAVGEGFGVQIKGWLADAQDLAHIKETGFGFVRFALGWAEVEQEKNIYTWEKTDALIARIRKANLKMVIPLMGGHYLYESQIPAPPNNIDHDKLRTLAPTSPESIQAFSRFAAAVALRYGSQDIAFEIWNEPDSRRFWPPQPDVKSFSVLAENTCKTIRSVAPHATIIGPSLGRVPDPQDKVTSEFFESFLSSGAASCLNGISVHPYRHGPESPEAVFQDYRRLFLLMAQHKIYLPLLNTEWGYTSTQVDENLRAKYAIKTRLLDIMWGVPLSIWYEWKDSRNDPNDHEGHFGLVRADGTAKPALTALQKILPTLRHAVLQNQIHTSNPEDTLLVFQNPDGTKILVGWSERENNFPSVSFTENKAKKDKRLSSRPEILSLSPVLKNITLYNP